MLRSLVVLPVAVVGLLLAACDTDNSHPIEPLPPGGESISIDVRHFPVRISGISERRAFWVSEPACETYFDDVLAMSGWTIEPGSEVEAVYSISDSGEKKWIPYPGDYWFEHADDGLRMHVDLATGSALRVIALEGAETVALNFPELPRRIRKDCIKGEVFPDVASAVGTAITNATSVPCESNCELTIDKQ